MRLPFACLTLLAALSACSASPSGQQVTVAGVTALTDADAATIHRRLDDDGLLAFLHPATTLAVRDGSLVVHAGSASTSDDDLRYLLGHQGAFTVTSQFGRAWLDGSGIADIRANMGQDSNPVLIVSLTHEGQQRLARFANRDAVGSRILVKLDDETISSAALMGPLEGEHFQVGLRRPVHEVVLMADLIRSGALSFRPGDVTVAPGARN